MIVIMTHYIHPHFAQQLTASITMSFSCSLAVLMRTLTVLKTRGSLPSPGPITSTCNRGNQGVMFEQTSASGSFTDLIVHVW